MCLGGASEVCLVLPFVLDHACLALVARLLRGIKVDIYDTKNESLERYAT